MSPVISVFNSSWVGHYPIANWPESHTNGTPAQICINTFRTAYCWPKIIIGSSIVLCWAESSSSLARRKIRESDRELSAHHNISLLHTRSWGYRRHYFCRMTLIKPWTTRWDARSSQWIRLMLGNICVVSHGINTERMGFSDFARVHVAHLSKVEWSNEGDTPFMNSCSIERSFDNKSNDSFLTQ